MRIHETHMREVFAIARRARAHGNRPFGAMLVAGNGAVLAAAENSQLTDAQILAHAEMNLLHRAVKEFSARRARGGHLVYERRAVRDVRGRDFLERRQPAGVRTQRRSAAQAHGFTPQMLVASARDVLASRAARSKWWDPLFEAEAEALFAEGEF